MENREYPTFIFILLVAITILWSKNSNLRTKNQELENQLSEYRTSLEHAVSLVEDANENINETRGYAWASYEEMGWALDHLSSIEEISLP